MIERAVRGAVDLRNDRRAKEANECLNVVPESEEIREAMKETRESALGLDGVRIGYIRKACESIQGRVIEIVQRMFEVRANEWDELVKVGAMVPLRKKVARDQDKDGDLWGCGKEMRAGNLARHQRGACRVWDPGGGGGANCTELYACG